MCLLGIEFGRFAEFPVLVLANREEFYARPSAGPRLCRRHDETPGWMGGVDLVAGGTWLGVNDCGVLVAVTNRKKSRIPENAPSRGLLCRKLLAGRDSAHVVEQALRELDGNRFAGCNLLVASCNCVYVIEAGDVLKVTQLPHGLHLLANAELNDPADRRIERVRREFTRTNPATPDEWFQSARNICQLPSTGDEPAICLSGTDRGTVSSTVLGIGRPSSSSRYWFAAGPPSSTAYDDQTPMLRELFHSIVPRGFRPDTTVDSVREQEIQRPDIEPPENSPARRAVRQSLTYSSGNLQVPEAAASSPYRILLRGPWEAEPLNRTDHNDRMTGDAAKNDLPPKTTVRLPATWVELFGTFRGCVRFLRKFHPPSNIEPTDRLTIAFDGIGGAGIVSLNGRLLGLIEPDAQTARFDVTGLLRTNNELQVDVELGGPADVCPGGLYGSVALEIMSG